MPETSKVKKSIVLSGLVGTGGLFVTGLMFIRAGAHVCSVYSNIRVFPLRVSSVRASYRERYLLILTLFFALHSDQYFALPTVL